MTDTPKLPARQLKVLGFIHEWQAKQHQAPSLGEIRDHLHHASHTGAVQITDKLVVLGLLRKPYPKGKARNFEVTEAGKALLDG